MFDKNFVASQLRKLAAKMEENFSFEEAEERGDFKAIYDHIVEKSFKKDWWKQTRKTDHNWGVPVLLPSNGSENDYFRRIIRKSIAEDIDDTYDDVQREFARRCKAKTGNNEAFDEFFEKYDFFGSGVVRLMKNKETINEFFSDPLCDYLYAEEGKVDGNWDFNSALKKYTLVFYSDGTWEVYTSNSPEEILKIAGHAFTDTGKDWEELADRLCHFHY